MISHPALSRLGFGVTGPHASIIADSRASTQLIQRAVALGVTYFDTGPAYGHGRAELRLGQALRDVEREQIFISTKAGVHAGGIRDFSPGAVEMSLKASLERLGTPYVDLLLLHGPAPEELTDKLMRHLEVFRKRGLFHHLGICGRGAELDSAIGMDEINAIMAPLNADIDAESLDRLQRCKAAGLSLIAIEVLKGATAAARLPLGPASAWYLARAIKQRVTGQSRPRQSRRPEDALRWAIEHPLTDSLVSLTTKIGHLEQNARLAGLEPPPSPA